MHLASPHILAGALPSNSYSASPHITAGASPWMTTHHEWMSKVLPHKVKGLSRGENNPTLSQRMKKETGG